MADGPAEVDAIFRQAPRIADLRERSAFVHRSCQGVAGLEKVVLELLRIWEGKHGITLTSAPSSPQELPAPLAMDTPTRAVEQAGERIGRYKLLEPLGEGGFGVVFLAEQLEPVRRNVALKVTSWAWTRSA